jgi:NADP-dependent 3-hydroxy acid dehydrogenase YdfG
VQQTCGFGTAIAREPVDNAIKVVITNRQAGAIASAAAK